MSNGESTFQVSPAEAGERLDRVVAPRVGELSRGQVQKLIAAGEVRVNGEEAKPSLRVKAGDSISICLAQMDDLLHPTVEPADLPLHILYEDAHILAINKPAGMTVHPVRGGRSPGKETLVAALLHHCDRLAEEGDPLRRGIVHRLDRDTSGVIVAAKTDAARAHLMAQFRERRVQKRYVAVTRNAPPQMEGEITLGIGRDERRHDRMVIRNVGGRRAITHYTVRERFETAGGFALVEARPRTGRTHQIRVHLSAVGAPVACDGMYGGGGAIYAADLTGEPRAKDEPPLIDRQALHAEQITFVHPATNEPITFTAPPADDLAALIAALR